MYTMTLVLAALASAGTLRHPPNSCLLAESGTRDCVILPGEAGPARPRATTDCEIKWAVRMVYQAPNGNFGFYWTGFEVGPLTTSRAEADARRLELEEHGYTEVNPWCPDPSQCSEIHHAKGATPFISVKQFCCSGGTTQQTCNYVDTLPPPAP